MKKKDRDLWDRMMIEQASKVQTKVLANFYQGIAYSAESKLGDLEYIAIDMETTGLEARNSSIVSIGLMPFNLDKIYPNRAKYWVLKPDKVLREESVLMHHITHTDIEVAPRFEDIFEEMVAMTVGKVAVVHYKKIERNFLYYASKRFFEENWTFPMIDTMGLEAIFVRQSRWGKIKYFFTGENESLRLHNSRLRYNLPAYIAHHALVDAMATAELFQAQVAHKLGRETQLREVWG